MTTVLLNDTVPFRPTRATGRGVSTQDLFAHQPTSASSLPDPRPLVENLALRVIEILAGARELEQISRWVAEDVYRHLLKHTVLATRARQAAGRRRPRPMLTIGTVIICEPDDGVVEAVAIVHCRVRARAVTVRLEGLDHRWRATAINVL